ncbi:MAG: hypothetical protein ABR575_08250 [Actinomycetota bacterium]
MAVRERVYRYTDAPMTWTRAIVLGTIIWIVLIALLGQGPSIIIYKFDQYIATLITWSENIPGLGKVCATLGGAPNPGGGCNTAQIKIFRDLVANGFQMTLLVVMLIGAYIWQERKRKRTGSKGLQDVVKGYMPGK